MAALALAVGLAGGGVDRAQAQSQVQPGSGGVAAAQARVIVGLKADAALLRQSVVQAQGAGQGDRLLMHRLGQRLGLRVQDGRVLGPRMHVALATGLRSEDLAAVLAQDPDVAYAVPDRWRKPQFVPDDPLYPASVSNPYVAAGQWYLRPPDSTLVAAINAETAWDTATGAGVTVGVVDSGVRADHPDLQGKVDLGYNMISYASVSGVSGGRGPDAADMGDWVEQADIDAIAAELGSTPQCDLQPSSSWHGTEVAGIVAAQTNEGYGMASVAPDARVLPVRVLGKCGGWDSDIIAGMRWAAGLPVGTIAGASPAARVLNLSLGAPGACSAAYRDVVATLNAQGVAVVASAGNEGGRAVTSPANCPGVIAVAGLRHAGTKVGYSSIGPEVSVSAPSGNCVNGVNAPCVYAMLSTRNTGTQGPVAGQAGATFSDTSAHVSYGTSFSAPQVSGVLALMLSVRGDLTPAALSSLLRRHARAFPASGVPGTDGTCHLPDASDQLICYCTTLTCGAGMLDAAAAVQHAATDAVAVIEVSPTAAVAGTAVQLDGRASMASPHGSAIVAYQWTLLNGGGIVSDLGADSGSATLAVTPSGAGTFQVRLTVQDTAAQSAFIDQWVVVGAAPAAPPPDSGGGGGGGGGAADWPALAGLLAGLCWQCRRAAIKA